MAESRPGRALRGASQGRQAVAFLVLAAAFVGLQAALRWLGESATGAGWQVATGLIPLAVLVWLLGRPLYRERRMLLGGGFLPFLVLYCALFAIADEAELLEGEREPLRGFDELPSNRFGLGGLGDWHYRVLPRPAAAADLLVVLIPADEHELLLRRRFADAIRLAKDAGAKGIAFDFYFEGANPYDERLCDAIEDAAPKLPVFFGTRHEKRNDGHVVSVPPPPSLERCLDASRLASLAGYEESDGKVRRVPVRWPGAAKGCEGECESLSVRVAKDLEQERLPASGLIQFTDLPPQTPRLDRWPAAGDEGLLRDRWIFVGCCAPGPSSGAETRDLWPTPFGRLRGVEIHARAAHSLALGAGRALIEREDDSITIALIFLLSYGLALVQNRGGGWKVLLAAAGLMSVAVVVAAVIAMRYGLVWLDVSYSLSAIWGLAPMLLPGAISKERHAKRRGEIEKRLKKARAEHPGAEPPAPFDALISYSREDSSVVRRIADGLERRGLRVWIDEKQIPCGRDWMAELQEIIQTAGSALLMMGPNGVGRWQGDEIRECLIEAKERHMQVVPVLLPGGPAPGELEPFVRGLAAFDARTVAVEDSIDALARIVRPDEPVRRLAA